MSSSSASRSSSAATHSYRLYVYPEVDLTNGKERSLTNVDLLEELEELVDTSEKISKVFYYTNPLNGWQLYKGAVKPCSWLVSWKGSMHHAYIVFKTQSWWWSIEKNDAGITIQRSKKNEFVRDKYVRVRRQESYTTGIGCEKSKTATNKTVKQLLKHIHEKGYVNEMYHALEKNCQEFADKIYEFL
jgi:hypothetical protein